MGQLEIYLCRHGETEWTLSGQHTGLTDIPLTTKGEEQARLLGERLKGVNFVKVLSSPLQRATKTCEMAGFGDQMEIDPNLVEWNYGDYEGITTKEIREKIPDWTIFSHGVPHGETIEQVSKRADRVIKRVLPEQGKVLIFSSGHISRVLGTRWIELPGIEARCFLLSVASISILGFEREKRAISSWNNQPTKDKIG